MSAVGSSENATRWSRLLRYDLPQSARAFLTDRGDDSVTKRIAGAAFLIRVASAAILYLLQLYLARRMGRFEFGIYAYVWTWVGFLSMLTPLGHSNSAQRLIPEYLANDDRSHLRGFVRGSRWLCFAFGAVGSAIVAGSVVMLGKGVPDYYWLPFMLGSLTVPIFAVGNMQDGIARSFDWIDLALLPAYILHPLIILFVMVALHLSGVEASAERTLLVSCGAMWLVVLGQLLILDRRLHGAIDRGPRLYELRRWLGTALPIFMIDGFYLLLTYVDVLVLQVFVGPADIAIYYTAIKTLALINFVYFAVTAASAHRFSKYHFSGERARLEAFIAEMIKWTFWPSLLLVIGLLAVGKFVLSLFGPGFADGYPVMFVLAAGLLARASVGPAERALSMIGQQRTCAAIYGSAFASNLLLCFVLIPRFGLMGAAFATTTAILIESCLLFAVTKWRLGFHFFIYRGGMRPNHPTEASAQTAQP